MTTPRGAQLYKEGKYKLKTDEGFGHVGAKR